MEKYQPRPPAYSDEYTDRYLPKRYALIYNVYRRYTPLLFFAFLYLLWNLRCMFSILYQSPVTTKISMDIKVKDGFETLCTCCMCCLICGVGLMVFLLNRGARDYQLTLRASEHFPESIYARNVNRSMILTGVGLCLLVLLYYLYIMIEKYLPWDNVFSSMGLTASSIMYVVTVLRDREDADDIYNEPGLLFQKYNLLHSLFRRMQFLYWLTIVNFVFAIWRMYLLLNLSNKSSVTEKDIILFGALIICTGLSVFLINRGLREYQLTSRAKELFPESKIAHANTKQSFIVFVVGVVLLTMVYYGFTRVEKQLPWNNAFESLNYVGSSTLFFVTIMRDRDEADEINQQEHH